MITYKLETFLNFGRYKGYTIKEAIDDNPDYLAWAVDEIEWFKLDQEATTELETASGWAQVDDYDAGYPADFPW